MKSMPSKKQNVDRICKTDIMVVAIQTNMVKCNEIHYGWAKHVEYIEKRFPEFTSSPSEQELSM